ncbi:MAG TPA: nitroreductase family protein [Dehalococcoidia bacterium]|nr:nitroreductase family protein [Dehalococcoidia bacterium]
MDVFEAIYTLRAIRRFRPDPVPDELIWKVLEAATKAPSGGNRQPWRFVVVRDPETKARIGQFYLEGWRFYDGEVRQQMLADPERARIYRSADYLARHLAEVPVLILACLRAGPSPVSTSERGSSIFPAVQNLLLAARALGLGGVLTTLHRVREREVRQLLGIPDEWETMALIPLGWPAVPFGPVRRLPVEEVVYWERWGEKRSR